VNALKPIKGTHGSAAQHNRYGAQLLACVQEWRQTERKGVWLRVPIQQAHLVPVATQQG